MLRIKEGTVKRLPRSHYAVLFLIWFLMVLAIWFWGSGWIRTHGGDVLIVGVLYWGLLLLVKSCSPPLGLMSVGCVALLIEVSQLFELNHIRKRLGEGLNDALIGRHFDVFDLLAYLAGLFGCVLIERILKRLDK